MFWVQPLAMETFPGTGEEEGWMVGELVKAKGISRIGNTHKETLSQSSDDPPHSPREEMSSPKVFQTSQHALSCFEINIGVLTFNLLLWRAVF